MKLFRSGILFAFGIFIVLAGFMYDLMFAGLPYQDPDPELYASWSFHKDVASAIIISGLATLALGTVLMVFRLLARIFRKRASNKR